MTALEQAGATVLRISGAGVPDLLVGYRGTWTPLEVKGTGGRLTTAQIQTRQRAWFPVVETPEQALAVVVR